jgi:riboflavin-specific deaminase-like protein
VIQRLIDATRPDAAAGPVAREDIYRDIAFPRGVDLPSQRPYTAINMVATVDGKVVVGGPGTTRLIGGETDHYLMAKLENQADAVLFGAGLIREDDPPYPQLSEAARATRRRAGVRARPLWAVVSTRGEFMGRPRVFQAPREDTALFTTAQLDPARRAELEAWTQVLICGEKMVDPRLMGQALREQLGVERMICLGGPALNATLIEAGVADELFLTLAPKLQGGTRLATAMEGAGYEPERLPRLQLRSVYADGGELYLRYKLPVPA